MKIFMTGATGLIGRALISRLLADHHEIHAWVRFPEKARKILPASVKLVPARSESGHSNSEHTLKHTMEQCDAVIHLAGESVAGGRWTPARKKRMIRSRVHMAKRIVEAIEAAKKRPSVLISASAVGFYGDQGEHIVDEQNPSGDDFLSRLCVRWEQASRQAEALDVRVVLIRLGIVLARKGGALAKMLPVARLGLAGPLGSGEQYISWIHIRDAVEIFANALSDDRYVGPVNATAPTPVTNREFMRTLTHALGRPCFMRVPAVVLKLALGEAASSLLGGQRAIPRRLHELNYDHQFPSLDVAIENLIH